MKASVKTSVESALFEERTNYEWKKASLTELFGPLSINLERSKRAYARWEGNLRQEELEILRSTNETVRTMILAKYHLIPQHLQHNAAELVAHYDVWLQTYNKPLVKDYDKKYTVKASAEKGRTFPKESAKKLRAYFQQLRNEVVDDS